MHRIPPDAGPSRLSLTSNLKPSSQKLSMPIHHVRPTLQLISLMLTSSPAFSS